MLVVVEGIGAAGKTTCCQRHAAHRTIPETGPCDDAPDPALDPVGAARFWVEQGARRWMAARAMERSSGIAVCDTDPLKLHYVWSLGQRHSRAALHYRRARARAPAARRPPICAAALRAAE
jgi:hypothetical protein